ncbi:MAG: DUF3090 family protein [Ilumatobacter sp.]|uniref:DUF3090 family protein n=1 Tax=Ilumatobacter sp. TaxID=1967498 RepID=UPI00263111B1|nr:DUF3090 family protein [Ilumatobacter sp.]MDJ0769254.1 DUF3090 family protein [Ilumatobacter sp.]
MSAFYEFEEVDTFTTGAIGEPGARVFYLQARAGKQRVAVKCEKQQVSAIVQYLQRVLNDLPPPEDRPIDAALELAGPVEQVFVLGPIGLGYDRSSDRLIVQLEEIGAYDDEGNELEGGDGHIRLYVTRGQAASFCEHAERVVAAGRPDCQWCARPIDPDGHACPRMN